MWWRLLRREILPSLCDETGRWLRGERLAQLAMSSASSVFRREQEPDAPRWRCEWTAVSSIYPTVPSLMASPTPSPSVRGSLKAWHAGQMGVCSAGEEKG